MKRFMEILGTFLRMKAEEAWEFTVDTAVPVVATVLIVGLVLVGSCYMIGWGMLGWDEYVETIYCPEDGSKTVEQAREDLVEDGVFKGRTGAGLFVFLMFVFASMIVYAIVIAAYRVAKFLIGNWRNAVSEVDFKGNRKIDQPGRGK